MQKINAFLLFTMMLSLFVGCKTIPSYNDVIPVHDSLSIVSVNLNEKRVINVWTPSQFKTGSGTFPVLYMLDGGIHEDFPHIANTLSELIANGDIPPYILVGIENTQRRRDLTGPTEVEDDKKIAPIVGGSKEFRDFIQSELFPEINQRYRTNDHRAIIGESLAGLFIVETLLTRPEMFDSYIAFDPSLWWNKHSLVEKAKETLTYLPKKEIKFWYAGSSAKDINTYTRQLSLILQKYRPDNLIWKYSDEKNEKHNTIFRATKTKALKWALGNQI